MNPIGNGLENDPDNSSSGSGIELSFPSPEYIKYPSSKDSSLSIAYNKTALLVTSLALLIIIIVGLGSYGLSNLGSRNKPNGPQNIGQLAANYAQGNLSVQNLKETNQLQLGETDHLDINGTLQVNKTLVITPTYTPSTPTAGEIYYNQATNQPYYYNGSQFVSFASPTAQNVTSLGGAIGTVVLGNGLQIAGNQLALSGSVIQELSSPNINGTVVTSLQGLIGKITVSGAANQVVVSTASGNVNIALPQDIGISSNVQFGSLSLGGGNLDLTPSEYINSDNISTVNNGDTLVINGGNNITFENQNGANTFTFPTSGGTGQIICTTAISCAGGGGQSVLLEPTGVQTVSANKTSIFVNKAGGTGNLIELQTNGSDAFVINNTGGTTINNLSAPNGITTDSVNTTGTLTVGSTSQPLVLQGNGLSELSSTSGGFTSTVDFTAPSASRTINFPDQSGTICLTTGNCLGGAGGGANTSLSNLSNVAINTNLLPSSAGAINLGSATFPFGQLYLAGSSGTPGTNNFLVTGSSSGGTRTITLPDASGTVCLQNSASCGFAIAGSGVTQLNGLSGALSISNASAAGSAITINDASTSALGLSEFNNTNFSVSNGIVNTAQNISTGSSPTFSALTLGNAGTSNGSLQLANSTNTNLVNVQGLAPTGTGNAIIDLPSIAGGNTDTVCLLTLANCVGTGGSVSTSGGTQNYVPKYTNAGATQLGNSEVYDNGTGVAVGSTTITGLFNVGTASQFNVSNAGAVTAVGVNSGTGLIQGTGGIDITGAYTQTGTAANTFTGDTTLSGTGTGLSVSNNASVGGTLSVQGTSITIGNSGATSGTLDLANSSGSNLDILQGLYASGTGNATYVLPVIAGASSDTICLKNLNNCSGSGGAGAYIDNQTTLQSSANFNIEGVASSVTAVIQGAGGGEDILDLLDNGGHTVDSFSSEGNLTVGNASSSNGILYLTNSTNSRLVGLQGLSPSSAGNATIQFPAIAGGNTDTVCLLTLANCVGTGGSVSTSGGTQNYVPKYTNAGATQLGNSEVYDNGTGVAVGSTTITGLFNVGTASQFNVSNAGAVTAVGVNSGTGLIQGTGGLTVSGGSGASISGGLNNNAGGITNSGAIAGVTGYTQTSGTHSVTSTTTNGNINSVIDNSLSSNNAVLNQLTFTNANNGGTATTVDGISISPAGTASGNNVINAINLSNVTTIAGNTFNALNLGTGYNSLLNYNNTTLINGTGILQSAAVSGTYSNLTGTGALTTGSIGSGFGSISTTNSIATTSSIQGGTLGVAGSDFAVDGSGNLSTSGTGTFQGNLTVGNASSSNGILYLTNSTNSRLVGLQGLSPSSAGNATIQFPAIAGGNTDTVCLLTLANCVGTGGSVSTSGGTQNYVPKYTNAGATQLGNSEVYDNGTGVAVGSTTITGLFNVGTASQFNVSNAGAVTAVGVNSGTGLIQGTGGLTVSGGSGASISGGLNNNAGGITNSGAIAGVTGYTQTSGTHSVTSTTTNGNINSVIDNSLSSNNAVLNQLTFTNANNGGTATTVDGISISPAGTASGNNVINAINLSNVTTIAGNTFNALNLGTGYNSLLNYNNTTLINGTGILQSAAVSGTYSNLTGTGALTTGSIGSGFGSISTTNSIATTSSIQGGTLGVAGSDFAVDGSGNLSTSGTGTFQGNLTVGNASSSNGILYLTNSTNSRLVGLQGLSPSSAGNATIQFPAIAGGNTDTVCLLTLANCVGTGGSVSTSGGTQNYVPKYTNAGATQLGNSEVYDNGTGVAVGSTTITGLFNVGTASQFNVSNAGAVTAVGVNSGTGLIQGTGGLTVSGGSGASISGGLNNNAGGITNSGAIAGVTGYTQTSGTHSVTSTTTNGNINSVIDNSLSSNNAVLNQLTFTNANNGGTATTVDGISISPAGTASGNNVINAINLSNVTTIAGNTFNALNLGTGYNSLLNYNNTTLINGTGILQSAAVSGTYSNLTGTGALTTGSIGSGFGSISTTNSIATTSSIQGGTLGVAGSDFAVDGSGNLSTSGSGEFYAGLTLGGAGSTIGNLYFGNTTNTNLVNVQGLAPTGTGNAIIDLPSIAGGNTDTVCLLTLANCVGRGGGVSTSGGTQNYVPKYTNAGATQLGNSEVYDNGTGVAVGSTTITGLFNVGTASQFNVSNAGAVTAVGVNSGTGLIQGTGGLTVSSGNITDKVNSSGIMDSTSTNSSTAYQLQNSDGESILEGGTSSPTNYVVDADFASGSGSSLNDWLQFGSPSIYSQNTTVTSTYEGETSLEEVLAGANEGFETPGAGAGLTSSPTTNNNVDEYYTVSFEALSSISMNANSFTVTATDSTGNQTCTGLINGSGTNVLTNSGFEQVYCTLQFTSVSIGSITQIKITTSNSSGVIYYDAVQLQLATSSSASATPSAFQEGTLELRGVITNPLVLQNVTNSQTAFQIQSAAGSSLLDVDSLDNNVYLGTNTGLFINGTTTYENTTNSNTVSISSGVTTSSYTLSLPATGPSTSQCLQSSPSTATQLVFASCATLQQAYNASGTAATEPYIDVTGSGGTNYGAVTIQNDNTHPISGNLFSINDRTSSGLGASLFSIQNTGAVTINTGNATNNYNSSTAFQIQNADGESELTASTSDVNNITNIVTDPDFALGTSTCGSSLTGLTDWTSLGSNNPTDFCQYTTAANTYEGSTSLELVTTTHADEGLSTTAMTSESVTSSSTYTVSFYVMQTSGTAIPADDFEIYTNASGGSPTCTGVNITTGLGTTTLSSSGFQEVSCTLNFTASGTFSTLNIESLDNHADTFYIDDIQVQSGTSATAFQLGGLQLRGVINNPVALQNVSNSTSAFQVQNAAGSDLIDVDTLDNAVTIANNSISSSNTEALLNVNGTGTLGTNSGSVSGGLVDVSRSLTANVSGGTATPTYESGATYSEDSFNLGTWTSSSFGLTCTNINHFIFVGIETQGNSGLGIPSAVKWNGNSMSQIGGSGATIDLYNTGETVTATYWGLTVGSGTCGSGAFTVTDGAGDDELYDVVASSYYNVSQSSPWGTFSHTSVTTGSSTTLSATSSTGQLVVDGLLSLDIPPPNVTKGTGTSQSYTSSPLDDSSNGEGVGSTYSPASAGTTTMKWNIGGTDIGTVDGAINLQGSSLTGSESVTLPVASLSNQCTLTDGVCTDATNVLQLSQNYSSASGAVLGIQNSGSGFGLQIQNGSSASALTVTTSNLTGIDSTTSSTNAVLTLGKYTGGDSLAAEGAVVDNLGDYAEYFNQTSPGQLQPGDVTCLNSNGTVEPCNTNSSDGNIVGVVSTAPGFVGNNQVYNASEPQDSALVSLLGQVPVKVSTANGSISVGDMLTMSSVDGIAAKDVNPGEVIGTALESYSGSGTGVIQVYIHPQFNDPIAEGLQASNGTYAQNGYSANFSSLNISGLINTQNLTVTGNANIASLSVNNLVSTGNITVNGHIVSGGGIPTLVNKVQSCTDAILGISGTDTAGIITFTTNSACAISNVLLNVNFSNDFTNSPNISLTPANANAAKLQTYVDSGSTSDTGFTISTTSSSLSSQTTYRWYYQVIQ